MSRTTNLILIYLLLVVNTAFAAAPEICGDGIDDSLATGGAAAGTKGSCPANYHDALIGNGCDADCTLDKDFDGYAYTDCDDTRADVYPGVYVPNSFTSPTGYKLCQTGGTYGATVLTATTPLCESVGGVCRYVDCGNSLGAALDANAGTNYNAPKLTIASAIASEAANDFTYLIGTGTCNENVTLTAGGTSGHVITIKNYPGSTAKIVSTTTAFSLSTSSVDFRMFDNLDIDYTSYGIDLVSGVSDVEISRCYIHDGDGNGSNNTAAIRATTTNRTNFHHNFFKDPLNDGVGGHNVQNAAAIDWLDTSGLGGGADHYGHHNVCWFTSTDATRVGQCWFVKHGVTTAEAGTNGHRIYANTAIGYLNGGVIIGTSKARVFYNRFYGGLVNTGSASFGDMSPSVRNDDEQVKYNTVIQGTALIWTPLYNPPESVAYDHNVVIDNAASYVAGNNEGIISIDGYGSDAQLTTFETAPAYLTSDYNCFYSPSATAVFSYYGSNSPCTAGAGLCNAGGNYSFANWQSVKTQDAHSFLQNPGGTAPKWEGTGNCSTFGYNQAPPLDAPQNVTAAGTSRVAFGRRYGK